MVQGIGPIFLSHFDHDPFYGQIHHDLIEAKGSFYNVVVPLYIPEKGATLYVGEAGRAAPVHMRYNVGTLLGAGTQHGTGECDYRNEKDVRLSVAIYLADVNPRNVEIVASDSTSLWPSQGDTHWFKAQRGRLWRRNDPKRSLKTDTGRVALNVQDKRPDCADQKELCINDPDGFRLECPKTCEVYMSDDKYYATLKSMVEGKYQDKRSDKGKDYPSPTCLAKDGSMEPTCQEGSATS
jgi:ShK domain-like